ncbi:hypothetical protein BGZ60DRAFT_522163 [Tricladium varicosporioides]|nr:hypothetical protein BGZ60DRAFT_522163 [Hymenoscyphus varicosporioides]
MEDSLARANGKRKLNSAVPTTRSKLQKSSPSTRRDEHDSEEESNDHDQLFVGDQPVTARYFKKSKTRKLEPIPGRVDEYEEDEGRMESQTFLALVQQETKKKRLAARAASMYLNKFESGLKDAEEFLKKQLEDFEIARMKRESDFLDDFTDSFIASRPSASLSVDTRAGVNPDFVFASLFKKSKTLLTNAQGVIDSFDKANKITLNIKAIGITDNNWEEEDENASNLFNVGRSIGLQKYESLLTNSFADPIEDDNVSFVEAIYGPQNGTSSIGWGRIARRQEKATLKIVKSFVLEAA